MTYDGCAESIIYSNLGNDNDLTTLDAEEIICPEYTFSLIDVSYEEGCEYHGGALNGMGCEVPSGEYSNTTFPLE